MRKILTLILSLLLSICAIGLIACGGKEADGGDPKCSHVWDSGKITTQATKTTDGVLTYTCTLCEGSKTESYKLKAPTATETYTARQKVASENVEGYNFSFSLGANLSSFGLGANVSGTYEGKYRNNKTTNDETFFRKMSGELFFDNTTYSYTAGDKKIRIDCDNNNTPEKASIMPNNDEGFFVNKAVVNLVNSIQTSYITEVEIDNVSTPYNFVATLNFGANAPLLSKITNILGNFGTKIAFKNVAFVNPAAIPIHFNIDEDGRLNNFEVELNFTIATKLANIEVFLTYKQSDASSPISVPNISGLSVDKTKISSDIATINQAILAVKNSNTYSLDAVAKNEFDPAWNKLAIVDSYTARLYKNKVDNNVWFNHSYEFKAHHEEDGAEKYAYTIGNIQDGSTYLVSRKGTNVTTPISNVSADSQFDYLLSAFSFNANNIDCISSVASGNTTVYKIHLNNQSAVSVQDKVLDIVNSNDASGVVDVNNYMSNQITIKKAVFVVTIVNGALSSIKVETDLKYNPIAGDYTDYNVTLTNVLELNVNKHLSKAQEYVAPAKSEGNILQTNTLDANKFYIL